VRDGLANHGEVNPGRRANVNARSEGKSTKQAL
jgi:hypothetical protein